MGSLTISLYSRLLLVQIVLASIIALSTASAWAQSDNLAVNAGFDNTGNCIGNWDADCPDGWRAWQSDAAAISIGTTVHAGGNRRLTQSLDRRSTQPGQTQSASWIKLDNVIAGEVYEFSAWVRSEGLKGRSLIHAAGRASTSPERGAIGFRAVFGPSGHSAWTRMSMLIAVADGVDTMVFALAAQTSASLCRVDPCGHVHFDNVVVRRLAANDGRRWIAPRSNVCAEGEFLDLTGERCRTLDKSYGYKATANGPANKWLACSEMSDASINASIRELAASGGTLALAPCLVNLKDDIVLASNVTVRGSGSGRTILRRDPQWNNNSGTLLRVQGDERNRINNVVLRDFTIAGSAPAASEMNNIQIGFADNVLVERIESVGAGKSGIHFWSSQNITVRHVVSHGALKWHGIGTKDCYIDERMDGSDPDNLVSKSECAQGVARFWTENIALYSNNTFNNGGLGIDSHASYGEIAGNIMDRNGAASKFPEPAHHVWIHHNDFTNSVREGTKIANQLSLADDTMTPHKQVLYQNRFANNASYGIRIHDRAWDVVLIGNRYSNNGVNNRLRIVPGARTDARVLSCTGDQSADDGIDGRESSLAQLPASDSRCDLTKIHDIFDR